MADLLLSEKYKAFLRCTAPVEFLEGTTAAGKTTVGLFKFILRCAASPKRLHVLAGLDQGTIEKNIITKALGVDYRLEPEFTSEKLQKGDVLLLCTDGLTNMVPVDQMEKLLVQGPFYDTPDRLIEAANANGGSDNITALLLAVEPTEVEHG